MTAIIRSRRTTTIAIIKPREDADAKDIKKTSKNHKIISEIKNKVNSIISLYIILKMVCYLVHQW